MTSMFITKRLLSAFPKQVRIVEVGLRDGLQNEAKLVSTEAKLQLLQKLVSAGHVTIEAGSFVSPKWVPQMKDTPQIFEFLRNNASVTSNGNKNLRFTALTPNLKGFEAAVAHNVPEVAVFGAASESFSQKNINCSIAESLKRFEEVASKACELNIPVRGYISCVLGCPYEGKIDPQQVLQVTQQLLAMGCYEISLGDTIGVGSAGSTQRLLEVILQHVSKEKIAVHFHDTYGQALSNIYVALQHGIGIVDSSVSGLGGCPYAKGASGNVATEDVVYLLEGLGIKCGVDLEKLVEAGAYIDGVLGRTTGSKVAKAMLAKGNS